MIPTLNNKKEKYHIIIRRADTTTKILSIVSDYGQQQIVLVALNEKCHQLYYCEHYYVGYTHIDMGKSYWYDLQCLYVSKQCTTLWKIWCALNIYWPICWFSNVMNLCWMLRYFTYCCSGFCPMSSMYGFVALCIWWMFRFRYHK